MTCELVEERLSAYLDNMLAPAERRDVTVHLQTCPRCMALLAELRQYDILLSQLPRVSPSPALRERIFLLPEVQELSGAASSFSSPGRTQPLAPSSPQFVETGRFESRPRLVSFSEDYKHRVPVAQTRGEMPPTPPTLQLRPASRSYPTRQVAPARGRKGWWSPWKIAIAAMLMLTLAVAGLFSLTLQSQQKSANLAGAITPPAGPSTGAVPLAAGSRVVFLRAGTLWSTLVDGAGRSPERLTPAQVTVASGWAVSPLQGNHRAGDLLAYIDVRGARAHTIRSDGQQDTPIPLALLPTQDAAAWQSAAGQTILTSLAWSPDNSMLAFVADPDGDGQTGLYLFTLSSGSVRAIATNLKGSFAHPVWSPDGTRLAFTLAHAGLISVLDYHIQSRSVLELSNLAAAQGTMAEGVYALNWFANAGQEAVTWCLGSTGHITSVWMHRVGANSSFYPQRLASGNYLQALYSAGSNNQTGGWLLVASVAGQAGDLWRLNLATNGQPIALSQGKRVSFARWSPDGSSIFYLDNVSSGVGTGHLVNVISGADQPLLDSIAVSPAPDWSADNLQLAYSVGTQIGIAPTLNDGQPVHLRLRGQITNLSWSPSAVHQLIVSLTGPQAGLYLVDTQQNTFHQLDSAGVGSVMQWTEIP